MASHFPKFNVGPVNINKRFVVHVLAYLFTNRASENTTILRLYAWHMCYNTEMYLLHSHFVLDVPFLRCVFGFNTPQCFIWCFGKWLRRCLQKLKWSRLDSQHRCSKPTIDLASTPKATKYQLSTTGEWWSWHHSPCHGNTVVTWPNSWHSAWCARCGIAWCKLGFNTP